MWRIFLFALLAGTLGLVTSQLRAPAPPNSSADHLIGERASLKAPFYGCANLDDEGRVVALAEHDLDAAIRTAIQAGCRYFPAGHVGIIKSSSRHRNHVCIRQNGYADCSHGSPRVAGKSVAITPIRCHPLQ
jgi:hypothetical protein